MSEKEEKLFDGITEMRDDIVGQAADYKFTKSRARFIVPVGIAAGICIAVGAGVLINSISSPQLPATDNGGHAVTTAAGAIATYAPEGYPSAGDVPAYGGAGTAAPDGDQYFWINRYVPPIMPLTAAGVADGITAERELTFDLSGSYLPSTLKDRDYSSEIGIFTANDSFTLTNTTDSDITVTLMYPFRCALNDLEGTQTESRHGVSYPTIYVEGNEIDAEFTAGGYSGKFRSAAYPAQSDKSNLDDLSYYEEYISMLKDGTYLQSACAAPRSFDEPVTVYRIHDYSSAANSGAAVIGLNYTLGADTRIASFGFNGFEQRDDGTRRDSFSLTGGKRYTGDRFLIVRGEDIKDLTINGYPNGFCEKGSEIPLENAAVERLEMTYGELLPKIILASVESDWNCEGAFNSYKKGLLSEDALCGAVIKYLSEYGSYSDDPIERYHLNDLQFQIEDAVRCERILYSTFDVTVPSGGSINVTARHTRELAIHADTTTGDIDYAIEVFPALGSTLEFTSQTADIAGLDSCTVTEQNMIQDNTDTAVIIQLDPNEEIYFYRFRTNQ